MPIDKKTSAQKLAAHKKKMQAKAAARKPAATTARRGAGLQKVTKPKKITQKTLGRGLRAGAVTRKEPEFQRSAPGKISQQYTMKGGVIRDEQGRVLSEAERDRLGRRLGYVEEEIKDAKGNVTGTRMVVNLGAATLDRAAPSVSKDRYEVAKKEVKPLGERRAVQRARIVEPKGAFEPKVAPEDQFQEPLSLDREQQLIQLDQELGKNAEQARQAIQEAEDQMGATFDMGPQAIAAMKQAFETGQPLTPVIEQFMRSPEEIQQIEATTGAEQAIGAQPAGAAAAQEPVEVPEGMEGMDMAATGQQYDQVPQTRESKNTANSAFPSGQYNEYSQDFQTGFVPEAVEDPYERTMSGLEEMDNQGFGDMYSMIMNMDYENMTPAESLKANFLAKMGLNEVQDQKMRQYFNNAIESAKEEYNVSVQSVAKSRSEIEKSVSGEKYTPTTFEGLQAKILKDSETLQLESIEAEKKYQKEQMDIWKQETTEKRSRLEGYLKGKLVAMGASDSAAGLQLMATQVHQADLRIQMQESEYNYGLARLDQQARGIMTEFTNSVLELNLQTKAREEEAQGVLSSTIDEIEQKEFMNEMEKGKLQMQAFSEFTNKLTELKKDEEKQRFEMMKFNYQKVKDAQDSAYKLSGLMGSYYAMDDQGNIFDTGMKTFDAKKWEHSSMLQELQYQHTLENDAFNQAMKGLDLYGSSYAPYAEQQLGMPAGSLAGLETMEERKQAAGNWFQNMMMGNTLGGAEMGVMATTGGASPVGTLYKEGAKGGQCGWFARTKFFNLGPMGDLLSQKIQRMDNVLKGFKLGNLPINVIKKALEVAKVGGPIGAITDKVTQIALQKLPKVGDMIIQDVGTKYGHVAVINSVNDDGTVTLTESNWNGDERIHNTRTIPINDASIVAIHRGDLKPEIAAKLEQFNAFKDMNPLDANINSIAMQNQYNTLASSNPFMQPKVPSTPTMYPPQMENMFKLFNGPGGEVFMANALKDLPVDQQIMFGMMNMDWQNRNQDYIKESTPGKPLLQQQLTSLNGAISAVNLLKDLQNTIQEKSALFDPIQGSIRSLNPYDQEAQIVRSQVKTAAQLVGKYLEGGVLRKEDEEKYAKMLPNIGDTPEVASGKLNNVIQALNSKYQTDIATFTDQGYSLKGYDSELSIDGGMAIGANGITVIGTDGRTYQYDDPNDPNLLQGYQVGFFK